MRQRLTVVGLIVLLLLGVVGPAGADESPAGRFARVDSYVREQLERTRAPGSAYAVISGEDVAHRRTWGRDGNGASITPRTPFLVGSVAKPVTAMAVMRLVEQGRIRLDDPVRAYLPWFRPSGEGGERVTVRHLLNQTSGISEREGLERSDKGDNEPGGVQRRARSLDGVPLSGLPGERHRYSAANFMLLGAVVEKVTGRPFGDHLTREILRPLGMAGTITDAATAERRDLAPGHRYYFGRPQRHGPAFDTSGVPYGYLGASLEDMSRFAAVQLGATQGVLSPRGIRQMHTGTVPVSGSQRYGLGWRDDSFDDLGVRTVWHGGATPAYQAIVVLAPEKRLAVVIQQNIYGRQNDDLLVAAGLGALRILLGADPEPGATASWYWRALATLVAVAALLGAALAWSLVRLVRPRRGRARSRRRVLVGGVLAVTACLSLAAAASYLAPELMGVGLRQVRLFAPDVGQLLIAVTALGCALAVLRAAVTVRALREATGGEGGGRAVSRPVRARAAASAGTGGTPLPSTAGSACPRRSAWSPGRRWPAGGRRARGTGAP
ncbi:hypothetical protein GCM10010252_29990 [Streptomyces aureoverticillatus]|nr:hypothetical protein GCM10010252_29990 [Streptomyces aureoverticillatus]